MSAVPAPRFAPPRRPIIDSDFLRDPYPTYHALREAGPIHWSEEFFDGAWLLTRHADVEAALRDPRLSARRTGGWVMRSAQARGELKGFQRVFARAMLFLDAPDHKRLRRVLYTGFRPALLQALAPQIERWVTQLLDAVDADHGFDLMAAVARPLPSRVIAALMGIEPPEQAEFIAGSDDLASFIGASQPTRELARRAQEGLLGISALFETLIRQRRRAPCDDLISRLIRAEAAGEIHGSAELLAQCAMLLFAGYETTRNLLGNGVQALLSHRDQWERLRREPALMPTAIRELLRFDSPVQYTGRRVANEFVLHGQRLRRGDLVLAMIGAANRDPAKFTNPDRLDISRREGAHLSFGHGPHVCIGAALTQMEAGIVLRQLQQRWPRLELLDPTPRCNGNAVYRGLSKLRVRCDQAPARLSVTIAAPCAPPSHVRDDIDEIQPSAICRR